MKGAYSMSSKSWVGLLIVLLGLGFLLQAADVWQFTNIFSQGWPLILIFIGLLQLKDRHTTNYTFGFFLIFLGILFFANQWTDINLYKFVWPLIIIFVGLSLLFARSGQAKRDKAVSTEHTIESFNIFGSSDVEPHTNTFEGGTATTIFGESIIDLRKVSIQDRTVLLDVTVIFGSIQIIVPDNVRVKINGSPILGSIENKVRKSIQKDPELPQLEIHCTTIFGSTELRD